MAKSVGVRTPLKKWFWLIEFSDFFPLKNLILGNNKQYLYLNQNILQLCLFPSSKYSPKDYIIC